METTLPMGTPIWKTQVIEKSFVVVGGGGGGGGGGGVVVVFVLEGCCLAWLDNSVILEI